MKLPSATVESILASTTTDISVPEDAGIIKLSGTATITSITVGPDKWGSRTLQFLQTSGVTTFTHTTTPTSVGQMNLLGNNVALSAGQSIEFYVNTDGTLIRTSSLPGSGVGLWYNAPIQAAAIDPSVAYSFFDDFTQTSCDDTTNVPTGWALVADAGSTGGCTLSDTVGGSLKVFPDGDDNDEAYLSSRSEVFKFAASKPMWFECRCRLNENGGTAGKSGFIIGVSDTVAANSLVDGGTLMTSFDGALFVKEEDATDIDFFGSNAATVDNDVLVTFVDGTWYRLGFYFDPGAGTTGTLTPYVNGTAYTAQNITLSGLEEMHVVVGAKMFATTTEASFEIDWIRAFQTR